jgi:protein KRI1
MPKMSAAAARGDAKGSKPKPKHDLFDDQDSNSEEDQEDGGAVLGGGSALKINEEYARKFEFNKKREELRRLEDKYNIKVFKESEEGSGSGSESSSEDETEDEDGFLVTNDLDQEISATLAAIKNKDPRIYDKSAVFYKPFDAETDLPSKEQKEKPVFLKDYHRERYMRGDAGADDYNDDDPDKPKTYVQEQADLKKSILAEINKATADDDSEGWSGDEAFIKPKARQAAEPVLEPSAVKITELDVVNADRDPDAYLSKFMASRAWEPEDGEGPKWQAFESDDGEDDGDLAEKFEHAYNMRFEDPEKSNEVLKSYSRDAVTARTVRQEALTGRKKQRQLEKERKEEEKREREEERRRLRRLKLEEVQDKLSKIKKAAGKTADSINPDRWIGFLDDAWDNDNWEKEMARRFNEDYYAEADEMSNGGQDEDDDDDDDEEEASTKKKKSKVKKPKWDDDIDIKDIIPDFDDEIPKVTLSDSEAEDAGQDEDGLDSADERPAKKRKTAKELRKDRMAAKKQSRQEQAQLEALVSSKMELDNPRALASTSKASSSKADGLGGFRYRETSPNSFGMSARDILLAPSDAALNDFAGLKKLASFRDADKKRKDKKRLGKKARLREWRRENFGKDFEHSGPTFGFAEVGQKMSTDRDTTGKSKKRKTADEDQKPTADGIEVTESKTKKRKRKKSKGKKETKEDVEV